MASMNELRILRSESKAALLISAEAVKLAAMEAAPLSDERTALLHQFHNMRREALR